MADTAVIFGASGISGRALAEHLLSQGLRVVGLSRRPVADIAGLDHIRADLADAAAATAALAGIAPTYAFYCTWAQHADPDEKLRLNQLIIRIANSATADGGRLRHVALDTGMSHYIGGGEAPFIEDVHRGGGNRMYLVQEEALFALAAERGFTWTIARPGTIIGYAPGNAMNLGTAVAVYATIARDTGRPFVFPGSANYYAGLADATDARLLARHLAWEVATPAAANKAFNVATGDLYRWKDTWARIAGSFGVEPAPYPGHPAHLAAAMADAEPIWQSIVARPNLKGTRLGDLAPFWHMDLDLNRSADSMGDMTRSRELGFLDYQSTWRSIPALFGRLRTERLIP